jgi:3-oxoadipate enol-lactonase
MTIPTLRGSLSASDGDADTGDLLVLLPSLGTTTHLWNGVAAALNELAPDLRILEVDLPGHGASPATDAEFSVADLAAATLRLVDEVGGGRFHLAGVSLGGAIGLELALTSDRALSLTLYCSGAAIGTPDGWTKRAETVRASGTSTLIAGSASRWFAPGYLERDPHGPGASLLAHLPDVDDESYALCCQALARFDRSSSVGELTVPSLVVAGEHDRVTTAESSRSLAAGIPGGRFALLDGASHLAVVEAPRRSAELLIENIRAADQVGSRG